MVRLHTYACGIPLVSGALCAAVTCWVFHPFDDYLCLAASDLVRSKRRTDSIPLAHFHPRIAAHGGIDPDGSRRPFRAHRPVDCWHLSTELARAMCGKSSQYRRFPLHSKSRDSGCLYFLASCLSDHRHLSAKNSLANKKGHQEPCLIRRCSISRKAPWRIRAPFPNQPPPLRDRSRRLPRQLAAETVAAASRGRPCKQRPASIFPFFGHAAFFLHLLLSNVLKSLLLIFRNKFLCAFPSLASFAVP